MMDMAPLESPIMSVRGYKVWEFQCDHEDDRDSEALPALPVSRPNIRAAFEQDRTELFAAVLQEEVVAGPLGFVEATWFQSAVGLVIFANAIIIGLETDIQSPYWVVVDEFLQIIFVAELTLRACHLGVGIISTIGNLFDVLLVTTGVVDMWVMPAIQLLMSGKVRKTKSSVMQVIQMLRLLRIIRLVRLVKIVQPLYRLALGIAEALQGMLWVLIFLAMMLYAVAILCTRLLGEKSEFSWSGSDGKQAEELEEVRQLFTSVSLSMFTLFEMMSCWSLMRFVPLFEKMPIVRLLAVLFYILTAWALLAVMTGVVNEKMIAVRETLKTEELAREEEHSRLAAEALQELFEKADNDESGAVTREEFSVMLRCTDITRRLMEHSQGMTGEDLGELFDWLDRDKDGVVDIDEFMTGFKFLNDNISPKVFLRLQEEASQDLKSLEKKLVTFINQRFDDLIASVRQPLRKIHAVAEQIQRFDEALSAWRSLLAEVSAQHLEEAKGRTTRAGLAETELRLSRRIDKLAEALKTLGKLQEEGLLQLKEEPSFRTKKTIQALL
mmetsp:Transcript_81416/g.174283  ORF Transcript_81416/g.174283 Transcript_81416/m.174283 type:complete len:554 (+) Transcript_81416:3-1664(+)